MSRWTRCPSPRWRSATPPAKTTSGWTPRCRSATRGRKSSSPRSRSGSGVSRSAPRPSTTWATRPGGCCSPGLHFRLAHLTDGAKAVGRAVAELGPVNQPLDMVSFVQDGEEYLLVANSAHGLVKIACRDIDRQSPLTEPQKPVGVPRETKVLQVIRRLANLGGSYVLALQSDDAGRQHLRSLKTASL